MKKIICVAFVLLLTGSVQGQQNNCLEAAGISTNPADPVNSQCDGDFVNTFDWMQEKFKVENFNCVPQPVDSVYSPFYGQGVQSTYHFVQQSIKDYLPEDGWELLWYQNTMDNLSFIMYNKYTSIIRVFSLLPRCGAPFRSQRATLRFQDAEGKVTGLLATAGEYTQTMDEESIPAIGSLLDWPTVNDQFMYTDYQVEYDPCTCNHDKVNDLQVVFEKITTADIRMVGRMTGYSADLEAVDGNDYLRPSPDYLTSILNEGDGAFESAGSHTFNT